MNYLMGFHMPLIPAFKNILIFKLIFYQVKKSAVSDSFKTKFFKQITHKTKNSFLLVDISKLVPPLPIVL